MEIVIKVEGLDTLAQSINNLALALANGAIEKGFTAQTAPVEKPVSIEPKEQGYTVPKEETVEKATKVMYVRLEDESVIRLEKGDVIPEGSSATTKLAFDTYNANSDFSAEQTETKQEETVENVPTIDDIKKLAVPKSQTPQNAAKVKAVIEGLGLAKLTDANTDELKIALYKAIEAL